MLSNFRTTVQPKDIKNLEQVLKSHETNARRNMHNLENNLGYLTSLIVSENKETREMMSEIKDQCDALDNLSLLNPSKQQEVENEILQVEKHTFLVSSKATMNVLRIFTNI